jgi:hypothetical protein
MTPAENNADYTYAVAEKRRELVLALDLTTE